MLAIRWKAIAIMEIDMTTFAIQMLGTAVVVCVWLASPNGWEIDVSNWVERKIINLFYSIK